ncbi:hemolysin family protein [Diplocloster hominis]|uniref:HlyC/CorC family transporter n=1 Tax=Diplocloster hominis TaxID=3079010 RepID=UPI0031BB5B2D
MDSSDAIQLVILLLLLMLSAFFSSAETALTTVNKIRIRSLAEEGDKRAVRVLKITEDSGKMLSAVLIGNNIVNLSASSMATLLATRLWGNAGAGLATGILTLLILVFGEISPKTLATIFAENLSLSYSGVIYLLMKLLTPVIFIVNRLALGFLLLLRIDPNSRNNTMTETELRTIVDVSHEDGVIETEEHQMIHNVFDFGDSFAKDVMIPRIDVTAVDVNSTYEEIIDTFREDLYTRLPVYEENTDDVIGILNVKDLLLCDKEHFHIRELLREPYYTYEYKKTSELLLEMRNSSKNVTIVLDEYGATAGLITLEDLLEEIVGEIRDEYDMDEEDALQMISDTEYVVDGHMKLDDLEDVLHLGLDSEDYDSIGGFIIEQLDHLPKTGESVSTENGIRLCVDAVDKNRIDKVHIYLPESEDTDSVEA